MDNKVKFAPLSIPFERRFQTFAAGIWIFVVIFGGFFGSILSLYLILFTRFWWLILLYLLWIYLDRNTSERGGRRSEWVKDWNWWIYFRNYFPIRLHRLPWIKFDTGKNYLFCCFPHGLLSTGAFSVFSTNYGEFSDYFPGLKPYLCILSQHFNKPFFRELALALNGISPSVESLNYVLSEPGGGNAVALIVGGAAESFYCKPRQYKIVLKNRKGFVRIALKNGSPLVPVFSFGETDLYDQVDKGENSWLKKSQEKLRKIIGLAPILPLGRGFFQYSFGLVPHRRPVNVVVGAPIPVDQTNNPTTSQIDELHRKFMKELKHLFDTNKHNYIKDADDVLLEIV